MHQSYFPRLLNTLSQKKCKENSQTLSGWFSFTPAHTHTLTRALQNNFVSVQIQQYAICMSTHTVGTILGDLWFMLMSFADFFRTQRAVTNMFFSDLVQLILILLNPHCSYFSFSQKRTGCLLFLWLTHHACRRCSANYRWEKAARRDSDRRIMDCYWLWLIGAFDEQLL